MEKLVRDKIPDIIRADGEEPSIRIASKDEFYTLLVQKLDEEVDEFKKDK